MNNWKNIIENMFYITHSQKINNEEFKKYFIIDLRKYSLELINDLLDDFDNFQHALLEDIWFSDKKCQFFLYFIYDETIKLDERIENIKRNIQFAFKDFVTEEELKIILNKEKSHTIDLSKKDVNLSHFNLLYGGNGSGKTHYLKELASILKAPYFSLLGASCYNPRILQNPDDYTKYLQLVLGSFKSQLSYYKFFIDIMQYTKTNNLPILIDDLGWNALDDLGQLRIVDALAEVSYDGQLVAITACQIDIEKLVRSRVYQPNIIDFPSKN